MPAKILVGFDGDRGLAAVCRDQLGDAMQQSVAQARPHARVRLSAGGRQPHREAHPQATRGGAQEGPGRPLDRPERRRRCCWAACGRSQITAPGDAPQVSRRRAGLGLGQSGGHAPRREAGALAGWAMRDVVRPIVAPIASLAAAAGVANMVQNRPRITASRGSSRSGARINPHSGHQARWSGRGPVRGRQGDRQDGSRRCVAAFIAIWPRLPDLGGAAGAAAGRDARRARRHSCYARALRRRRLHAARGSSTTPGSATGTRSP